MRIGIDFDNTIAGYDHVFSAAALRDGSLPPGFVGGKREVRAALEETDWMRLQGQVYGPLMQAAELLPGAEDFFLACAQAGHSLFIVSHKTRRGHFDESGVDLRQAALQWMHGNGFFEGERPYFRRENVSFHATRAAKLERISALALDVFVDDLPAVLLDAGFPASTRALLYGAREGEVEGLESCPDWRELGRKLLGTGELADAGFGVRACPLATATGGGNNRLVRVQRGGRYYALKTFQRCASDPRDRLGSERAALEFLQPELEGLVPRLEAANAEAGALLMEWIEGQPVGQPTSSDVEQLGAFLALLHALCDKQGARALPLASEACLSASELVRQIEARRARLRALACVHPSLEAFLSEGFEPALERRSRQARLAYQRAAWDFEAPLPLEARSLSPSDFGFHNALRSPGGRLRFLDFEYFGWDDPVKLLCDSLLHPGMGLDQEQGEALARSALATYASAADGSAADFRLRLQALYGLYGLRWCCILLNVFLPERQRRLAFAEARQGPGALGLQLDKAKALLRLTEHTPNYFARVASLS